MSTPFTALHLRDQSNPSPPATFDLGLEVDDEEVQRLPDIRTVLRHQFTALPRKGTPAAKLTDRDKVALAIAAGVEVEFVEEGGYMHARTLQPIGVADRGDGGYIIGIGPKPRGRA